MGLKTFLRTSLLFVPLVALSCGQLTVPQSVAIKTNAAYEASVGTVSKKLSEYADIKEIFSKALNGKGEVFDYQPNNTDNQIYGIKYPVKDLKLDLSDALNQTDSVSKSGEYELAVLDVSGSAEKTIQVDSSAITEKLAFPESALTVVESDTTVSVTSDIFPSINMEMEKAQTVTYKSGALKITLTPPSSVTSTFERKIKISLKANDGTILTTSNENKVVGTAPNVLSLPLTGVTLPKQFTIVFTGTVSGGNVGQLDSFTVKTAVSSDAIISKITGVTLNTESETLLQTFSIPAEKISSARIASGTLDIESPLPTGCTGLNIAFASDEPLGISGGLVASKSFEDKTDSNKILSKALNLSGSVLTPSLPVSVSGKYNFNLENATLVFDESGKINILLNAKYAVTKFEEATIAITEEEKQQLNVSVNQKLSEISGVEAISSIKQAVFTVSPTYKNNFPLGNDISLVVSSTNPGMQGTVDENTDSVPAGATVSAEHKTTAKDYSIATDSILLDAKVTLPGDGTNVTLKNLETGNTYKFEYSFNMKLDFDEVTVSMQKIKDTIGTTSGEVDLSDFNLKKLLEKVPEKVTGLDGLNFEKIPVYFYATAPRAISDNFSSAKIGMSAKYKDSSDVQQTKELVPEGTELKFFANAPLIDVNETYKEDLDAKDCSVKIEKFTDVVNARGTELKLNYSVDLGSDSDSVTIRKADIEDGATVQILAIIVLPLNFSLEDDLAYELYNEPTKDLLQRSSATGNKKLNEIVHAIESFSLKSNISNNTGLPMKMNVSEPSTGMNKDFLFEQNSSFVLNQSEISSIVETYPYAPKVTVLVPKPASGEFYRIKRDASFTALATFLVKTNGTITLFGEAK